MLGALIFMTIITKFCIELPAFNGPTLTSGLQPADGTVYNPKKLRFSWKDFQKSNDFLGIYGII